MHQSGKYSPTRYIAVVSPLAVALFQTSSVTRAAGKGIDQTPEKALPNIKMRNSKMRGVKAMRKYDQPPSPVIENEDKVPMPAPILEENAGAAPRPRKRSFRPPDVRTIFEPVEKDPRVKEEKGEGHSFCPDLSPAWCDVCCQTIFQDRLTCTGEWMDLVDNESPETIQAPALQPWSKLRYCLCRNRTNSYTQLDIITALPQSCYCYLLNS